MPRWARWGSFDHPLLSILLDEEMQLEFISWQVLGVLGLPIGYRGGVLPLMILFV